MIMAKAAQPNEGRRANRRGAARLAAVQALYQMDLAATPVSTKSWLSSKATGSAARSKARNICRRRPRFSATSSAASSPISAGSIR